MPEATDAVQRIGDWLRVKLDIQGAGTMLGRVEDQHRMVAAVDLLSGDSE
jgi:hypothetical protein